MSTAKPINILFDGPPSAESGRFVEVETDDGRSVRVGEWIERPDGLWALRLVAEVPDPPAPERDMRSLSKCWQNDGWHVYGAGPCFEKYEQAIAYRDGLDREGITWRPQR